MYAKTKTLNLRVDPETHSLLTRAADICGKSLSSFMTEASVYSAQRELLEQRFIRVNSDVFEAIDADLSSPGVARKELEKLFKGKVDWID